MQHPRTTIIMPVYNTSNSVLRAIDSVLNQTDPDFELLIINDQSPDDSDTIIRQYLASINDSRVSYWINEQNLGLAATRNRGIEKAQGDWLAYLDSDDAFKPTFLETMHNAVTHEVDVVVCAHDIVESDGTTRKRTRGQAGFYSGQQAMLALLKDNLTPYAWDKIFRKATLGTIKFPIVNRTEDAGYAIPAYQNSRKIRVISDSLHLYTVNPQSITWGSTPPIAEMYKFVEYLKQVTGAHKGTQEEQDALATGWILTFLNGAQSALRLEPDNMKQYLNDCREALKLPLILRTCRARPVYGLAALLLKTCPSLYQALYTTYVKKTYGL